MPDLQPFTLPDGTIISGRVAYNDYCRRHNVTNPADYKEQWAKDKERRETVHTPGSGYDSERRKRELAKNYKEFKTYGEFRESIEKLRRS